MTPADAHFLKLLSPRHQKRNLILFLEVDSGLALRRIQSTELKKNDSAELLSEFYFLKITHLLMGHQCRARHDPLVTFHSFALW